MWLTNGRLNRVCERAIASLTAVIHCERSLNGQNDSCEQMMAELKKLSDNVGDTKSFVVCYGTHKYCYHLVCTT